MIIVYKIEGHQRSWYGHSQREGMGKMIRRNFLKNLYKKIIFITKDLSVHSGPENFNNQTKKLVKSNKLVSRKIFWNIFHKQKLKFDLRKIFKKKFREIDLSHFTSFLVLDLFSVHSWQKFQTKKNSFSRSFFSFEFEYLAINRENLKNLKKNSVKLIHLISRGFRPVLF